MRKALIRVVVRSDTDETFDMTFDKFDPDEQVSAYIGDDGDIYYVRSNGASYWTKMFPIKHICSIYERYEDVE